MVDVKSGTKSKYLLRLIMWYFKKKYSEETKTSIKFDMDNCGNPVIRKVHSIIKEDAEKIDTVYHRSIINDFSELGLWVMYKDTAYRQYFFYVLKHILEHKDELMPLLDEYQVEPSEWYMNAWIRTKKNTADKIADGKIVSTDMSYDEKIFVPEYQHEKFDKIYKNEFDEMVRDIELEKKKKGWS